MAGSPFTRRIGIGVIFIMFFVYAIAYNVIGTLVTDVMETMGMELSHVGFLMSAMQAGILAAICASLLGLQRYPKTAIMRSVLFATCFNYFRAMLNRRIFPKGEHILTCLMLIRLSRLTVTSERPLVLPKCFYKAMTVLFICFRRCQMRGTRAMLADLWREAALSLT